MQQHPYTLSQLATIQSGVYCKAANEGDTVYLQARHFNEEGRLTEELLPEVDSSEIGQHHLLQAGDVLFAAKGSKNFAAFYEIHNARAVASTTFFVIRLFDARLDPAYLCWWLNSEPILKKLADKAKGTNVPAIAKANLEVLTPPLPPLEKQHLILNVVQLNRRATLIEERLLRLRERKIQMQLDKTIKSYE